MKKTRIALAIGSTLLATSAFATNGTNMTGVGAHSVALGGTGTAAYFGAENVIINPGMIGKSTGTEVSFGGTLFKPSVKNENNIQNSAAAAAGAPPSMQPQKGSGTSAADTNLIPAVALSSRINDSLTFGIGMFGTSGMGVDYKDATNVFQAQTQMQIMKFSPTLAYNSNKFGLGFSPVIQYGSLDLNFQTQMSNNMGQPMFTQADGSINSTFTGTESPAMKTVGSGVSSDLGIGFNIGGYFDITKDIVVAASYQSPINMKYKNSMSVASSAFVNPGSDFKKAFGDDLEQPSEIKLGAAYTMGAVTVTGDFKRVSWSDAKGYKDFGWDDQNIISIGAKYAGNGFWVGAGFNKADNPIKEQDGNTYKGAVINMFNNMFFPAITETHYSIGGGYQVTKSMSIDAALMISPETSQTVNTNGVSTAFASGAAGAPTAAASTSKTTHSQTAGTLSVRYNF